MSFLHKVDRVRQEVESRVGVGPSQWMETHQALAEYLTCAEWPDGEARQTSTLLIFCEAGEVKVCLNDREQGRSLWATGSCLEAAFLALESRCQDEKAEWRVTNTQAKPTHRSKKKR